MDAINELSYEAAYEALQQAVTQLEQADLPLEESVALYERGRLLAAHCQALLDAASLRMQQIDQDGRISPMGDV